MRKGRKLIVSLLIALLLCFSVLAAGAAEEAGTEISVKSSEISQTLARINTLYQYLKVNSFYDIEEEDIEENLTRALMASLNDPYAAYFTNDEAQDMEESIAGSYVGLGVYISKYDPLFIDWEDETTWMLQITSPFPGGPADRAGLRAKDYISHINGESVAQMTVDEASELLKGEEGVPVTLTVHRGSSVFTISVAPEKVTTPTISYTMLEGTDYGYLAITTFSTTTYPLVSEALSNLTAQGMKALIIDLRNNGGGTVNSASLIANYFVQTGDVIFTIEYKDGSGRPDTVCKASNQTRKYSLPVVILVNGGTASASEILSAALQDNSEGIIIGQQTFGKGIIQDVIPWNEGFIRYTSSHYLTPDGHDIHEVGITPDIIVEEPPMSPEQTEEYFSFINEHEEDIIRWTEERPEYTTENIEAFVSQYLDDISFDPIYLSVAIRNQYIVQMDWNERPVADPEYDIFLKEAVSWLDRQGL